jgi:hypothetical protein
MVAVSALGWGAVMAGRSQRYEVLVNQEQTRRADELRRFQALFGEFRRRLGTGLGADQTLLAQLAPVGIAGGGAALELVSPHMLDFVVVHVSGLPRQEALLPSRVWLVDSDGHRLRAGRLTELDANGGGEVFHQFANADLSGYTTVVIRNAEGHVALTGVAAEANA